MLPIYQLRFWSTSRFATLIVRVFEAGITKIYLRVDVCGVTLYPTKEGKQYVGDGRDPGSTYLVNTLKHYDPAARTVELGHRHGLKVWAWDTLFDDEATMVYYGADTEPELLIPAQLMFGDSSLNARGSGLPVVALRSLAMQASIRRRFGEYPLRDPFLVQNPPFQWRLDPRIDAARQQEAAAHGLDAPITAIRISSDSRPATNRVTGEMFDILVSNDNRRYRVYDGDWEFRVESAKPPVLLIDGLQIHEPYIKLAFHKPWPTDQGFTVTPSFGAGSDHMDHVNTQRPYALTAALIACIFYVAAGMMAA
jgi:hypothetical protein